MLTSTSGLFAETFSLALSDEDLPGAASQSLAINVRGLVVPPPTVVLDVADGTATQAELGFASITGSSSLTKSGAGTLLLDGINTFTGETSVEAGILALEAASGIANSATVTVAAGAALDLRQVAGGYTVSNQTLAGSGTILGEVTFGRGSTISPGGASAGSLSLVGRSLDTTAVAVPEPGLLGMLAAGLGGAALAARRRPRNTSRRGKAAPTRTSRAPAA